MAKSPVKIFIPSHRRSGIVGRALRLFPSATVLVDERERDDYAKVVPPSQLDLHPSLTPVLEIREFAIRRYAKECHYLVNIDDDVHDVMCFVGNFPRRIHCPNAIMAILDNCAEIAESIGATMFGFNMSPSLKFYDQLNPFKTLSYVDGVFGVRCATFLKHYKFDRRCGQLGSTADLCLQTLERDKVIWQDKRFYFDFGLPGQGDGGMRSIQTASGYDEAVQYLHNKWQGRASFIGKNGRKDSIRFYSKGL